MQYQQEPQTLRALNQNDSLEVTHHIQGKISIQHHQHEQNSLLFAKLSDDDKLRSPHVHDSEKGRKNNQQTQYHIQEHNHIHEDHFHQDNGHSDIGQNSFSHNSQDKLPKKNRNQPKNYGIMVYIILSVLGCFYLETQHFNLLLGDHMSRVINYMTWFDIAMILWSYVQTHRLGNQVPKMSKFMNHDTIGNKLVDPKYLLTARHCDKCNYYKLPRVSHCSTCGQCIYKLDHHCMWTQTCIGHCNQRPFIWFCIYMTIGVVQFWISTVRTVIFMTTQLDHSFFTVFEPGVYILWLISCFSATALGLMVFQLVISHILMICTNGTTLDSMKRKVPSPLPFIQFRQFHHLNQLINTFDRGQIQNLRSLFGTNILTFWLPFGRQIENEFIIEPMNPQPTKRQLMKETDLFDWQMDEDKQRYNECLKMREIYRGKRFMLDGEEIIF